MHKALKPDTPVGFRLRQKTDKAPPKAIYQANEYAGGESISPLMNFPLYPSLAANLCRVRANRQVAIRRDKSGAFSAPTMTRLVVLTQA
jgi:hypothetical protein